MSIIGNLRSPLDIERAFVARLRERYAAYLVEALEQADLDYELAPLRGVIRASELATWPEDAKPVAVVVCPGTVDDPESRSDGYYTATYSVTVAVIAGTSDHDSTRDNCLVYGAAVRGAILQQRSLGGNVTGTKWMGESLDDLDPEKRRTLLASLNVFYVDLEDMVSWKEGPPPDGPWPDPVPGAWPTVLTHDEQAEPAADEA